MSTWIRLAYLNIFCLNMFFCFSVFAAPKVKITQAATVKIDNKKVATLKPRSAFALPPNKSVLIESRGHIPLLIVPADSNSAEVTIDLPKVDEWAPAKTQDFIEKSVDDILANVFLIQQRIVEKKYKEALSLIDQTKVRYPQVKQLGILRISTLVLLGRRAEALESLTITLQNNPTNEEAQKLVRALRNSNSSRRPASQ